MTVYTYPPCQGGFFDIVGAMFLIIQSAIMVAQNPHTSTAKKAATRVQTGVSTAVEDGSDA